MIRLKRAVLTWACSENGCSNWLELEEKMRRKLYILCKIFGVDFQKLKDDLLDVFADQAKFCENQVGGDIIANKKNVFLLIKSLELAKVKRPEE